MRDHDESVTVLKPCRGEIQKAAGWSSNAPLAVSFFILGGALFLSSAATISGASAHLLRSLVWAAFLVALYLAVKFGGRHAEAVTGGFFVVLAFLDLMASYGRQSP